MNGVLAYAAQSTKRICRKTRVVAGEGFMNKVRTLHDVQSHERSLQAPCLLSTGFLPRLK